MPMVNVSYFQFQSLNMSLMNRKLHWLELKKLHLNAPQQWVIKYSLLLTSQLSLIIEKKRFALAPSVHSLPNTPRLKPFWHRVTILSLVRALVSLNVSNSTMVWTSTDLLQEKLLNKLLLVMLMQFMDSKFVTHFTMDTFYSLKTLVNSSLSKDIRTPFFFCTHSVDGAKTMMCPLILVFTNIKHSLMMALYQVNTLSLQYGQAQCTMVVQLKFYGTLAPVLDAA